MSIEAEKVDALKKLNETLSLILAELRQIRQVQQQIAVRTK
jgi:hypothetical protein